MDGGEMNISPVPSPLSLRRNVFYAAIAQGVFALSQWGIIIITAQLGTVEQVGIITLVTALITPIFMLAQMAMRDGHSVDDLDRFSRADYVALRLYASIAALIVSGLLILTYLQPSGMQAQYSALAFALVKLAGAQMNMNHGIFQRAERLDYVAASMLVRAVLGLSAYGIVFLHSASLPMALMAEALAWWACLWLVDLPYLARLNALVSLREALTVPMARLLALARWMLPLGLAIFFMNASNSIPRLVLEHHAGLDAVGIFGAIAYINVGLGILNNALGTASSSRLRRLYRDNKKQLFLRLSAKLTALATTLGLTIWLTFWLAGEHFLRLMYGPQYVQGDIILVTILAAALHISASPLQFALNAGQAFRRRMLSNALVMLIAVVVSLHLIPTYGILGAAWSLVILSVFYLLLSIIAFLGMYMRMSNPH